MPRTENANLQVIPSPHSGAGFRLDFTAPETHPVSMKNLLRVLLAVLFLPSLHAASIQISGTLTWKITQPDCTFKLDGSIANYSQSGTTSGTLKMVLWATPAQFPSKGYAIAEHTMGQLAGGYQFKNFTKKVSVDMPKITGNYYFAISILEYTYSGWLNRAYVTSGRKQLDNGEFVTGIKWPVPLATVIAPPAKLLIDDVLVLTPRADAELDGITPGTRAKTTITIAKKGKAEVEFGSEDWDSSRTYTVGKSNLRELKVPVGKLYLDPEGRTGSSTITLFFQTPTSGTYRAIEENSDGGGTYWGLFKYKSPSSL